jgi:hypothetical protein
MCCGLWPRREKEERERERERERSGVREMVYAHQPAEGLVTSRLRVFTTALLVR